MRNASVILAMTLLPAIGCLNSDPAAEDSGRADDELTASAAALAIPGTRAINLNEQAAAAAVPCAKPASLYPLAFSLLEDMTTPDPVEIRHPVGVDTLKLFGGTYFLKGMFASIGKSCLTMQSDGNFVLYDEKHVARWASNTFGTGSFAKFQVDGNLVVYDANGHALVTNHVPSNTCCHTGWNLHLQADGNVVIYSSGWVVHWSTGTNH